MMNTISEHMIMTHFGEWLRAARLEARFSQDELAERANVSKNYISTLERNLPNYKTGALPQPSRTKVEALALALGKPMPEALSAAGYTPTKTRPALPEGFPSYDGKNLITIRADGEDYEVNADGKVTPASPATKADLARLEEQLAAVIRLLGGTKNES